MLEDDSSCQLAAAAYIVFEEKTGTRGKNLMGKKKVTGRKYIQAGTTKVCKKTASSC